MLSQYPPKKWALSNYLPMFVCTPAVGVIMEPYTLSLSLSAYSCLYIALSTPAAAPNCCVIKDLRVGLHPTYQFRKGPR